MAIFDFISGDEFRTSLEADYHELKLSMEIGAWKAVHILAGSIIEAILLDYLVASEYQNQPSEDILKMDLYKAISACRAEGILSERTEHLSHAIRSYRNLIHPGRLVRLNETANQNGAKISQALVEIVVEEVAAKKREKFGYTAEQIVTKLERDPAANAILGHMLKNTTNFELERLLIKILPERYFDLMISEEPHNALHFFENCFRAAFSLVPIEIKKKVTIRFARIVEEEVTDMSWRYVFFRGSDLEYLPEVDAELIKKHLFSGLENNASEILMRALNGIGKFLNLEEVRDLVLICMIIMLKNEKTASISEEAKNLLEHEYREMGEQNQEQAIFTLSTLKGMFETQQNSYTGILVDEMLELLISQPPLS